MKIKKFFLVFAAIMVIIIALLYGICPNWFANTFLGMPELNLNIAHILRAVMCLYIAFAIFWVYGAFSDKYRDAALLSTIVFSSGLVTGRIISYFADGQAAPLLTFYILAEFVLVPVAIWVFLIKE